MSSEDIKRAISVRRILFRARAAHNRSALPIDTVFTCDDCPSAVDCRYAWDDYNTNGDCLAVK